MFYSGGVLAHFPPCLTPFILLGLTDNLQFLAGLTAVWNIRRPMAVPSAPVSRLVDIDKTWPQNYCLACDTRLQRKIFYSWTHVEVPGIRR